MRLVPIRFALMVRTNAASQTQTIKQRGKTLSYMVSSDTFNCSCCYVIHLVCAAILFAAGFDLRVWRSFLAFQLCLCLIACCAVICVVGGIIVCAAMFWYSYRRRRALRARQNEAIIHSIHSPCPPTEINYVYAEALAPPYNNQTGLDAAPAYTKDPIPPPPPSALTAPHGRLPNGWNRFVDKNGQVYYQRPDGSTCWTIDDGANQALMQ